MHPSARWPTVAEALAGADVVCAVTGATESVVLRELLDPATHVNSVGFSTTGREIDAATVRCSLVAVEQRSAALTGAPVGSGDLAWPALTYRRPPAAPNGM